MCIRDRADTSAIQIGDAIGVSAVSIGFESRTVGKIEHAQRLTQIYEETCQLVDASVHVNGSYEKTERTWDTVEVLVDEDVTCREDAVKLGIKMCIRDRH